MGQSSSVDGSFYKVNALSAPVPAQGLRPCKNTLRTALLATARLRFLRGAQETLGHKCWITTHQQTFPGPQWAHPCAANRLLQPVRRASIPAVKSFRGEAVPVMLGQGGVGGRRTRASQRQYEPMDSTRTMQPQTWPLGRGLNTEKMVPSYRPHVCEAPHRDNNGSCPSSSHMKPHNSVIPHTSLAPQTAGPPQETR